MAKTNQARNSDSVNNNPSSPSGNVLSNNNKNARPRAYPKLSEEGSAYIVPSDSKKNQESPKIKVEYPLLPPSFESVDRNIQQPRNYRNQQPEQRNVKQEEHDSNTVIMGKTVYLMFEGEIEGGYLINSVADGDSSNPPLRGILFKPENSHSTGYDNPDASSGTNNVPLVATAVVPCQGVNHASSEKEKSFLEEIILKRSSLGALMSPKHLGSGTSMDFDFDKLAEEVSKRIKVGPYFDKLVDEVSKTIKAQLDFANSVTEIKTMRKDSSTSGMKDNAPKETLQVFPLRNPDSTSRTSKRIKLEQDKTNEELGKKNKGVEN